MSVKLAEQDEIGADIVARLENQGLKPTEVLDLLVSKYTEPTIKDVILRLLQDGIIEMTPNRQLQKAKAA